MREFATVQDTPADGTVAASGGFYRRKMHASLAALEGCELTVAEGGGSRVFGKPLAGEEPLRTTITVRDADMYRAMALNGSVGAAEAYMDGAWDMRRPDRPGAHLRAQPRPARPHGGGLARLGGAAAARLARAPAQYPRAAASATSPPTTTSATTCSSCSSTTTMMYSSAIFRDAGRAAGSRAARASSTASAASSTLTPADHLLEIGTGWGGMALHAATHYGCRVTTTTISKEQHALAVERDRRGGLSRPRHRAAARTTATSAAATTSWSRSR